MNNFRFRQWLGASMLALLVPLTVSAQTQPKIVTFGADLTSDQRSALLQHFGAVDGKDTIFTVTTDEMRTAMQNIIPVPEGYTSVSSTALTCAAPGSGLQVSTENITKVSAAMYAAALVTAGVGDAGLMVAAPADAQAEGMTGLTGVFKGLESGICGRGTLDPKRRDLAYRQLAVTADLAQATDGDLTKVSDLMLRAQQNLVHAGNNTDAAVPSAESAQHDTGVTLPKAQSDELVQLLGDMGQAKIDWGTYAGGWSIQQVSANEVRVAATATSTTTATTPAATSMPSAATTVATAGQQFTGTVSSIAPLRVTGADVPDQLAFNDPNITVLRNDQPAKLSDLQPNDTVTITLDAKKQVQRIEARSASGAAAAPAAGRTVQGTITRNTNGTLSVNTGAGNQDVVANGTAVQVRRNGQAAQLSDIQSGDTVTAQLDANGRPSVIEATGAQTGPLGMLGGLNLLWCLVPLLLIPLLFLLLRRRRRENDGAILVGPNRSTIIDDDGDRTKVDNDKLT